MGPVLFCNCLHICPVPDDVKTDTEEASAENSITSFLVDRTVRTRRSRRYHFPDFREVFFLLGVKIKNSVQ